MSVDTMEALAALLADEVRLGKLDVTLAGRLLLVRRGKSLAILVEAVGDPAAALSPHLDDLAAGHAGVVVVGDELEGLLDSLPKRIVAAFLPVRPGRDALCAGLAGVLERVELRRSKGVMSASIDRYRYELGELIEIGKAISQERDIDRLLDLILVKSRFVTGADAGSIYVVETSGDERRLHFKTSQNDSVSFESSEFTMPISTRSIAGYTVVTRRPISIPDVTDIPADAPFGFDASFDRRVGYRTRSMISVPMISAEDEPIGVIQLINKKITPSMKLETPEDFERRVIPFDERSQEMLTTLASQAGIALENALLYDEIRRIFEGFVRASVQAIEQRDPTTSGHSLRVSVLSCGLAEKVDRLGEGPYKHTTFSRRELKELEYASLLHDFGKIGVREQVLVKAKKLYPHALSAIQSRVWYATATAERDLLAKKLELMAAGAGASDLARLDEDVAVRRAELEGAWRTILEANEPTVLSEGDFTRIEEIAGITFLDGEGALQRLLLPDEVRSLQVRRGSLNNEEMAEIRSHVVHTKDFLSRIPWGKSFMNIPEIAGAHHEKLNGSGYPKGIHADEIPVASKIMTIADIYDALTARDRPYKKAVPNDRALGILGFEVKDGHLDAELVRIFTESRVFEEVDRELSY